LVSFDLEKARFIPDGSLGSLSQSGLSCEPPLRLLKVIQIVSGLDIPTNYEFNERITSLVHKRRTRTPRAARLFVRQMNTAHPLDSQHVQFSLVSP
ncbi:MAG TPA: hypothetical protein VGV15_14485, partial [Terriglobales bacterium]|nr:hypothetical protein [Terriglobales bacterium]